jgi:hypothetical protein
MKMRIRLPRAHRPRFRRLPLPLWLRVFVLSVGWALVVVGVVGLFLPVIQGGISLVLGAALLSIASQTVHLQLRRLMGRWPAGWKRLEKLRRRMHGYLHRFHPDRPEKPDDE